MKEMRNAHAIVTGGGSGIGRALALHAAQRGARVSVADIRVANARETADEIVRAGGAAQAFALDVADAEATAAFAAACAQAFGRANLVFSNAGVFSHGRLERTKPEDFRWLFEVNVFGAYHCALAFIPHLREAAAARELAHVVITASETSLGVTPAAPLTAYTASKHAVLGLADGLRADLARDGVSVSALCPGPVDTNLWESGDVRQARFGGPKPVLAALAEGLKQGQSPAEVARIAFQGVDAGEFLIATNLESASFALKRAHEVETAFARLSAKT